MPVTFTFVLRTDMTEAKKNIVVSPDLSLQLTTMGITIEINENMTVQNVIDKAKIQLKVPFPDSSSFTLYPKNYDTPLDESELIFKETYVINSYYFEKTYQLKSKRIKIGKICIKKDVNRYYNIY